MDGLLVKSPSGAALGIEFVRLADRYQHVIYVEAPGSGAGGPVEAMTSAEGDSAEAWPPSPPLQRLSVETLADGRRVALLVGMAGRGHWSASVETDETRTALIFDIACRSSVRPERLLSCYQVGPGIEQVRVVAENTPPAPANVMREGEWLAVTCPMPSHAQGPTWRWRYRIELLPV